MALTNFPNGITVEGVRIRPEWQVASKAVTFAGGTTNAAGDVDGTGNPRTLFTVTGVVMVSLFAVCSVDLAGATATLEVGCTGATAALIAQTTATDIDANDIWRDATPAVRAEVLNDPSVVIGNIIETVGTANITAGGLTYYAIWWPVSADGNLVAA